ncbi:NAD(P)-binding protein [Amniculicola lignicola CBS 123094]|uniref:NAD(P)-binding protein n=1 Tax=Amniculicola lignicola CBS 123094 TaxID=1392246 RepID=A0A6A5WQG3_9PLEO|nr:NAD(P)-binding protein [Amniculicola lignicola CBS 123094]
MATTLPATHAALVQNAPTEPLKLTSKQTPNAIPGSAVVQILSSSVVSYAKAIFNGTRRGHYPTPLTPGPSAIGRIAALGPDSTFLHTGKLVYIDLTIRSRDNPSDVFLLGFMEGVTSGSKKLMREVWRDGTWAEYCRVPLENVFVLNEERLTGSPLGGGLGYRVCDLATLSRYLVVYGGLRDIDVRAGETVVVAPATGGFGGAAVMVAVAMGASVIAMGRNEEALAALRGNFEPSRVLTVKITGDVNGDAEQLKKMSGGPIDAAFDISPAMAAKSTHLKSCISSLRQGGRVSLMGGIYEDVPIPYMEVMRKDIKLMGKWMYSRQNVHDVIKRVETDILKIGAQGGVKNEGEFGLDEWEKAFDKAEEMTGWNSCVVMKPVDE